MNKIIGALIIVIGVFAGLYVGIWVLFIGGIIQVIEAIRATELLAMPIALGIARVLFASFVTSIIIGLSTLIGTAVYKN